MEVNKERVFSFLDMLKCLMRVLWDWAFFFCLNYQTEMLLLWVLPDGKMLSLSSSYSFPICSALCLKPVFPEVFGESTVKHNCFSAWKERFTFLWVFPSPQPQVCAIFPPPELACPGSFITLGAYFYFFIRNILICGGRGRCVTAL